MAELLDFSPVRALTVNADPVAGAKAYFYDQGTTTPRTVYTTSALSIAHPTPLEADANGYFAPAYSSTGAVKVVVTDADDTTLYTLDPVFRTSSTASAASSVTYAPSTEIAEANVQDALDFLGDLTKAVAPIAQGSLSGAELIIEIPAYIEAVTVATWNYLPSTTGTALTMQIGTGTVGSPTWITSYDRTITLNASGTLSGLVIAGSTAMALSPAQITSAAPGSSETILGPFNTSSAVYARTNWAGVVSGPSYQTGSEFAIALTPATHTLLRIFVTAGTMAGSYRITGYRKP